MNISFVGDVIEAESQCHKVQLVGRAFIIESGKQKQLAHTYFENEKMAEQHLDGFVFAVAEDHLRKIGLSVESAKTITVVRDDEAVTATEKSMNNSNPYLH